MAGSNVSNVQAALDAFTLAMPALHVHTKAEVAMHIEWLNPTVVTTSFTEYDEDENNENDSIEMNANQIDIAVTNVPITAHNVGGLKRKATVQKNTTSKTTSKKRTTAAVESTGYNSKGSDINSNATLGEMHPSENKQQNALDTENANEAVNGSGSGNENENEDDDGNDDAMSV